MNKIKRAIIMAAGIGSRMNPITLNTPKPLVKVNGKVMIESIIEALHENDIFEIYVVVGYLKEQFNYLEKKYNQLVIIENPYYDKCNNIASLYVAREYIDDTIILDGDQIIYNKRILHNEFEKSGYSSMYVTECNNEWLQTVVDNKVISCSRNGGKNGYQLYSVSRWTKEDGNKLKKYLELEFEINKNHQIYWDDVVMFLHKDNFDLQIYEINPGDIIEIDNFAELVEIDSSYSSYIGDRNE